MKIFKRNTSLGVAALLGLTFATASVGAPTTFTVSTLVPATCAINSAANLTFPNYNVLNAADDTATSLISASCSKGTVITVSLSTGSGTFTTRTMKDTSANVLNYNLYTGATTSPACTAATVWGDGSGTTTTVSPAASTSKGTPISLTVHGCIPAGQDAVAGASETYTDTITVTFTFT